MPASTALNETNCARVMSAMMPRQRGLAGAGRAPQDDRLQQVALDRLAQRPARRRAAPPGRRTRRACAAASARRAAPRRGRRPASSGAASVRSIEQRHQCALPLACALRNRISAAATATLSDSTGGCIGIVTRSSAASTSAVRQARAFAAEQDRDRAAQVDVGERRAVARHGRDDPAAVRCAAGVDASPAAAAARRSAAAARCPSSRAAPSSRTDRPCLGRDHAGGAAASAARTIAPTLPGSCTSTSEHDQRRPWPRRAASQRGRPAARQRDDAATADGPG